MDSDISQCQLSQKIKLVQLVQVSELCFGFVLFCFFFQKKTCRKNGTWASVVVARGLSCPMACGIFLEQGLNPHPLHWRVDSQPVDHERNPRVLLNEANVRWT